jgi:hypothetical protein
MVGMGHYMRLEASREEGAPETGIEWSGFDSVSEATTKRFLTVSNVQSHLQEPEGIECERLLTNVDKSFVTNVENGGCREIDDLAEVSKQKLIDKSLCNLYFQLN